MLRENNTEPLRVLHVLNELSDNSGVSAVVVRYLTAINSDEICLDVMLHQEPDEKFKNILGDHNAKFYVAPQLKYSNIFIYIHYLYSFFKSHKEYSIIHGHLANAAIFYLGIARLCGIPLRIIHSHSTKSSDKYLRRLRNIFLNFLIKFCANVHCACSKTAATFLFGKKNSMLHRNYFLVHNAINPDHYAFSQELREKMRLKLGLSQNIVIGHIGRFCELKNHSFLLDIFADVHQKLPQSQLLLIGDGELKNDISKKIKRLGQDAFVQCLGIRSDVPELLQAMDILILPSIAEGLPLVAIEAQATGLPCILSDSITHEVSLDKSFVSFISLKGPSSTWANKIISVIAQNNSRKSPISLIKKSGYDIHSEAKRLTAFYKRLIASQELIQKGSFKYDDIQ